MARLSIWHHAIWGGICLAFAFLIMVSSRAEVVGAKVFMERLAEDAIAVLTDEDLSHADRQQNLRTLLRRGFDMDVVSRFVLGRYWRIASEADRVEFRNRFEDSLIVTYSVRLGTAPADMFRVVDSRAIDDGAIVSSEVRGGDAPVFKVDWRLQNRDGDWRVVDIMVEGISMAVAQRAEFAAVIRANGGKVSELNAALHRKIKENRAHNLASR